MVKNKVGGNKAKKFARKNINAQQMSNKKLRISESEDEMYAICTKMLGNSQIEVFCLDGYKRLCFIRKKFTGKNKHNNLIRVGTWVIVGLRTWESVKDDKLPKTDLLEMYNDIEKDKLIQTVKVNFDILKKEENNIMNVNNTDMNNTLDLTFSNNDDDDNDDTTTHTPSQSGACSNVEDKNVDDDDSIDFDDI